jgi:hypothetical protein
MDKIYGNHLGIVVNVNDPEHRGRVQVFIPHISNTIYTKWNDELTDKNFNHIFENGVLGGEVFDKLIQVLPWAECSAPIFGGGTAAIRNNVTKITNVIAPNTLFSTVVNAGVMVGEKIAENLTLAQQNENYNDHSTFQDKVTGEVDPQVNFTDKGEATNTNIQLTIYGNPSDPYLDSNTAKRIGNSNNKLVPGVVAMDPQTRRDYGLNNGDLVTFVNGNGDSYTGYIGDTTAEGLNNRRFDVFVETDQDNDKLQKIFGNNTLGTFYINKRAEKNYKGQELDLYGQQVLNQYQKNPYTYPQETISEINENAPTIVQTINHNSGNTVSNHPTSTGTGMLSIPLPGTKVWVFFHGGDIQKPVYFACQPEPQSFTNLYEHGSPSALQNITETDITHTSFIGQKDAGGIVTSTSISKATGTLENNSHVQIYSTGGSFYSLNQDGVVENSSGAYTKKVAGGFWQSIKGSYESFINGLSNTVHYDDVYVTIGKQSKQELDAANELKDIIKSINDEKIKDLETEDNSEMVPSPVSETEYLVPKKDTSGKVMGFVRSVIPPYFNFAFDVLNALNSVFVSTADVKTGSDMNGGSSGLPQESDGMIPSPVNKIQKANETAANKIKDNTDKILDLEQKLGNGGSYILNSSKDIYFRAGLVRNDLDVIANVGDAATGPGMTLASGEVLYNSFEKNKPLKKYMVNQPDQIPGGNLVFDAYNKLQLISGSSGIDMYTKGQTTLNSGALIITSESDITLASENHTIVKGRGVTIDADDRSGSGGLMINAKDSYLNGAIHVKGDANLKGNITTDGELSAPYLVVPSMRQQTTVNGTPDIVTNTASWSMGQAIPLYASNLTKNTTFMYSYPGYITTLTGLTHASTAAYHQIVLSTIVEPMPTGFCVTPYGVYPIFNYHHVHHISPQDHSHDHTLPLGTYLKDRESWVKERGKGSSIPALARVVGDGPSPGPKSRA